jgi:Flp pilus assembly protein TadG
LGNSALKTEKKRHRRGAAAVEFACILPVFLLIFVAMIEFGRGITALTSLTNAAREGCRHAILRTATQASTQNIVSQQLVAAKLAGCEISVSPDPGNSRSGDVISVSISVPFTSISWIPNSRFMRGKVLTSKVVMQKE